MALTKSNFFKKPVEEAPKLFIETSWDDGATADLKVAELLKKYNLSGVFYIIVDQVGQEGYLNWEQIKQLDKDGFEIGSHTMSHPADLKRLYDQDLRYEVQSSKDILESVLGHTVSKFCYPRGRFDQRVRNIVGDAGYLHARTTGRPGITKISDPLAVSGTIHIFDRKEYDEKGIVQFAMETIDRAKKEGGYVNIWGHSWEIEKYHLWNTLEKVLEYAAKAINK